MKIEVMVTTTDAAEKTGGLRVESSYVWASACLTVYYNSSTKVVSGANTSRNYTYPAASNVVNKVTAVYAYSATGNLTAKVGGVTKDVSTTVKTN